MKHLKRAFRVLGFAFQYGVPIYLFSGVFPYTHGTIKAGLTGAGVFALVVALLIIASKTKDKIKSLKNHILSESLLSVFPVVLWVGVTLALNFCGTTIATISGIWSRCLVFIIIGRLCYIASSIFESQEDKV